MDAQEEPIGKVDVDALKAREAKAVAEAKNAEANIGKGVSKEAQELFDHMNRMYAHSFTRVMSAGLKGNADSLSQSPITLERPTNHRQ